MDWIGLLVVAVVIATGIVLVSRRWRDGPKDRGPFSTAMEARREFAILGKTLDPPPDEDPEHPGEADRPER